MAEILRGAQKDRGAVRDAGVITFLRGPTRGGGVALAVALILSGCAPARLPVAQPQAAVEPAGPAYATVIAVRPLPAAAPGDETATILAAMEVPPGAATTGAPSSEIVVRTDDGATLSVVQPNSVSLAPGQRVMMVARGGAPSLLPAPPPS